MRSGNLRLRLDPSLHTTLSVEAESLGISLNSLIVAKLLEAARPPRIREARVKIEDALEVDVSMARAVTLFRCEPVVLRKCANVALVDCLKVHIDPSSTTSAEAAPWLG